MAKGGGIKASVASAGADVAASATPVAAAVDAPKVDVVEAKTKTGKVTRVAVIPYALMAGAHGEAYDFRAKDFAVANECTHYRVISNSGQVLSQGKVGEQKLQKSYHY